MTDRIEQLERRIERMEAIEGVRRTLADYVIALDTRRYDDLGDLFAEDAVFEMVGLAPVGAGDGTYRGRASIINDFYARLRGARPVNPGVARVSGHFAANQRIDVDGDAADSLAYFWEIVPGADGGQYLLGGIYQHRLRRDPDRWRFTAKRITVTFRTDYPAREIWGRSLSEVIAQSVPV